MHGTPTYRSWHSMIARCSYPSMQDWRLYGGRGITVCERWRDFRKFLADMGERPDGCSLDRIDSDGNYEPGNCRWATASEQQRNKRSFRGTHCRKGHEFAEAGAYVNKAGSRQCKRCAIDRARRAQGLAPASSPQLVAHKAG